MASLLKNMVRDSTETRKENMESETTLNFFLKEWPIDVAHHISSQRNFLLDKGSHHLATLGHISARPPDDAIIFLPKPK